MKTATHVKEKHVGEDAQTNDSAVLRPMNTRDMKQSLMDMKKNSLVIFGVYIVLILFGVGTGYLLASQKTSSDSLVVLKGSTQTDNVVGVQDASKYTDCPTGQLEKGGIDGEGTHHLIRSGGPSQTAYLMSSLIDLDEYTGKTVKICGQTMRALHAPWLMDVERLELQQK